MQAATVAGSSSVHSGPQYPEDSVSVHSPLPLDLIIILPTPLWYSRALRGWICNIDIEFMPEYSQTFFSLHFNQLWVSAFMIIQCTKKFLWWQLRIALIYGYNNKYLEGSLVLCLFKKVMVISSPFSLWSPQPWILSLINSVKPEYPPMEWALNSIRNCLTILEIFMLLLCHRYVLTLSL